MIETETEYIPITIPLSLYERLLRAEATLRRLEIAGVDNWEGYGEALSE